MYPVIGRLILTWKGIILILTDTVILFVGCPVDFQLLQLELVFQLEVGTFTVGQRLIFRQRDLIVHAIIVSAVVGDVQFTIAVDHRQVATAIQSTSMLRSHGDEVTVEDIIQRCRRIAEYRRGIIIALTV